MSQPTGSEPTGLPAPLTSDTIPDEPQPSDVRYILRKVADSDFSAPEDDYSDRFTNSDVESEDIYSEDELETPWTSVQGPAQRWWPMLTSIRTAEYEQSPEDNTTLEEATFKRTSNAEAPKGTVIPGEPKGEPPANKGKGRATFNSASAADDLASFAPVSDSVAPSSANSPSALSDLSDLPADYLSDLPADSSSSLTTNKRKLEKMDDIADDSKQWEPVNQWYSKEKSSKSIRFRCTLCWKDSLLHYSNGESDMRRHLQSLKHAAKQFVCARPGCLKTFTRKDALKRHMSKTCRRR